MMGRLLVNRSWCSVGLLAALMFVATGISTSAGAEQLCAVDLNNSGDAADPGETAGCVLMADRGWHARARSLDTDERP
jgi:hypothetical protein